MITDKQLDTLKHLVGNCGNSDLFQHELAALRAAIDTLETHADRVAELEQEVARLNLCVNDLEAVAIQLDQLFKEYAGGIMPWYRGVGYERSILANTAAALAASQKSAMEGQTEAGAVETSVK